MTSGVWGTSLGQLEGKDGDGRRLRFSTLGGARSPPPPPPDPASTRRACTPTAREGAAGEEGGSYTASQGRLAARKSLRRRRRSAGETFAGIRVAAAHLPAPTLMSGFEGGPTCSTLIAAVAASPPSAATPMVFSSAGRGDLVATESEMASSVTIAGVDRAFPSSTAAPACTKTVPRRRGACWAAGAAVARGAAAVVCGAAAVACGAPEAADFSRALVTAAEIAAGSAVVGALGARSLAGERTVGSRSVLVSEDTDACAMAASAARSADAAESESTVVPRDLDRLFSMPLSSSAGVGLLKRLQDSISCRAEQPYIKERRGVPARAKVGFT